MQDHPKSNNPSKEASQMLILKVIRVIAFGSFGIVKDPFWLVFFNYLELTEFKTIVNVGENRCHGSVKLNRTTFLDYETPRPPSCR